MFNPYLASLVAITVACGPSLITAVPIVYEPIGPLRPWPFGPDANTGYEPYIPYGTDGSTYTIQRKRLDVGALPDGNAGSTSGSGLSTLGTTVTSIVDPLQPGLNQLGQTVDGVLNQPGQGPSSVNLGSTLGTLGDGLSTTLNNIGIGSAHTTKRLDVGALPDGNAASTAGSGLSTLGTTVTSLVDPLQPGLNQLGQTVDGVLNQPGNGPSSTNLGSTLGSLGAGLSGTLNNAGIGKAKRLDIGALPDGNAASTATSGLGTLGTTVTSLVDPLEPGLNQLGQTVDGVLNQPGHGPSSTNLGSALGSLGAGLDGTLNNAGIGKQ